MSLYFSMVVEGSPREPWIVAFEHEHQTFDFSLPSPERTSNQDKRE